ncbi:MAG TPA: hypothetical protein VGI26_11715 [Solirubrobacteraceae bacterium]|jgi:hypothetical protein
MSVSAEVQRTLVKSPPELWAELSDADSLMRHLGELGEIRITNVEPETKVEWEAGDTTGVVVLKPSGWGTKVTLTVTRNPGEAAAEEPELVALSEPEPEPEGAVEPERAAKPEGVVEPEAAIAPELAVEAQPETTPEPESVATVEPEPLPVESEQRLGFFARLFRRRKTKPVVIEPEPAFEVVAMAAPEPIYPEPPVEPVVDLAAELASVEAQMAEETTELLTGVLDRLGAAHHRPFSRG